MPEEDKNKVSKAVGVFTKGEEGIKKAAGEVAKNITGVTGYIEKLIETLMGTVSPFVKVQSAAAQLAKSVGLAGKSIMSNSMNLIEQNKKMQLSKSYGISNEEMMQLQMNVMGGLGRSVKVDMAGTATPENPNFDSTLENLVAANQLFGPEVVTKMTSGFDKLGLSMKTAAKATGKLFAEASTYGINAQKYAENFTNNIEMAQRYNFRNGINGLKEMARKATEIRQDMGQIAAFADKVGSVTGAVETAANLQVLGGSFAALSNPLTMLNKSLTDVNGLQEMFNDMTKGAATYNSTTHQIEMDPVTRQIMKRAATSMGVDPNNFIDQAYAQARRTEVEKQMNEIGGFSKDVKKMLPNVAEIDSETGAAGATIDGQFKTLAQIAADPKLQEKLVEETKTTSDDVKDIAKSVMGIENIAKGLTGQIENELAGNATKTGIISGKSSYELLKDMLIHGIDEESVAGAANMDQTLSNLYQNWNVLTGSALNEIARPFSSTNAEEFGTKLGNTFSNIFGDSTRQLGNELGNTIATAVEKAAKKLKEYGIYSIDYFKEGKEIGIDGRTEPIEKPEAAQNHDAPAATPARGNSSQTENLSANGRQNIEMPPLENVNALNRARAEVLGENDIFKTLMGVAGNNTTLPIAPTLFNGQTSPKIGGTNTSIPSASVNPAENKAQTTTSGQQTVTGQNKGNESQTLNITGTLTMNVNGDNGKVGAVDLINNPDFMRELAKAIADAYAKMGNSGLVFNK